MCSIESQLKHLPSFIFCSMIEFECEVRAMKKVPDRLTADDHCRIVDLIASVDSEKVADADSLVDAIAAVRR
jgi:hypothetical protein